MLDFPTRHQGPVQMTTNTALDVIKRVTMDCDSFFLPTIFPQQLVDCATRGINGSARGDSTRGSSLSDSHHMHLPGWLLALDVDLLGPAW